MGRILGPGQLHGRVVRELTGAAGHCHELVNDGLSTLGRHGHELALYCLVLEGSCTEHLLAQQFQCDPLSLLFHPPYEEHATTVGNAELRTFVVEVSKGHLDLASDLNSRALTSTRAAAGSALSFLAIKLYREFRQNDALSPLAIEGLTLELLTLTSREGGAAGAERPPWLQRAVDVIHDCFRMPLCIQMIAARAGVHPVHLARVFRRIHGVTMGEYQRRLRIEFACRQLAQNDLPISRVALETGFADQAHFSRAFKQVTGTTPRQYRASIAS